MKTKIKTTQKIYNLTFTMENFTYTFGRNVLQDIIKEKFPLVGCGDLKDREFIDEFQSQYPNVSNIHLIEMPVDFSEKWSQQGRLNLNAYVISKLR